MQYSVVALLLLAAGTAYADLHKAAACVSNRRSSPVGGTGWSVSYNWQTSYEVLPDATKCACDYYKQRNTGSNQWDTCPDCTFDGLTCNSAAKHIGGDEMTYYCEKKCGAAGAEAD
ncbi:uncharacterized protein LTHEOB_9425 [Lasiodiplodia theobromae]|uniref:uncharacterized protein n=1 Tax=Lasiodiplodia theobromae TaxID=45133 RepID=UPI0015C3A83F|nr:uncharacterized protein LTHEOB_9425 [Lasiodiplodia theobromae]KAF4540329.1 hypothetical protein LTHEOB_9425 [Lasiodiplodia theobromae]